MKSYIICTLMVYYILFLCPRCLTYRYQYSKLMTSSRLLSTLQSNVMPLIKNSSSSISVSEWSLKAKNHALLLESLVYPPGDSLKNRMHLVTKHPIYNFLHSYYRYSVKDLKKYSPGLNVLLEEANEIHHEDLLINRCMQYNSNGLLYKNMTVLHLFIHYKCFYYYIIDYIFQNNIYVYIYILYSKFDRWFL